MKAQSAKGKGRRFQQEVMRLLIEILEVDPEDIESRSMGAGGEDLVMGVQAKRLFPFSPECKNVERLNFWEAFNQAQEHGKETGRPGILFARRNRTKPVVVLDAEVFLFLLRKVNSFSKE